MIRDVLTVMWKEWRDLPFLQGVQRGYSPVRTLMGSARAGILAQLAFVFIFGVFMPYQSGRSFLSSGIIIGFMVWAPFVLTSGLSADAFAGERERKTLETLLASRLSDRAILFGKMATLVCYAWAVSLVIMLLAFVTVNVQAGYGKLVMYPAAVAIGGPIVAFLAAVLLTSLGVIVSLKAATVRQAAQTMSLLFLLIFLIPVLTKFLPKAWAPHISQWMARVGMAGMIATLVIVLVVLDVIVMSIAVAKFRRSKLILD